jgi:flavin-dependent dehydrogenase
MRDWDAVVIGGGPAGSTASGLLAARGYNVLVLEKEHFPRFHIGESLLPAAVEVQRSLGIEPRPDVFNFKRGAQFVDETNGRVACFDFNEALPGPPRFAYHVERPRFDALLLERAAQLGAEVRHGVRAQRVEIEHAAALVHSDVGAFRARYVIDATGQDRLLARQAHAVEPFRHFGKAASFMHFDGIDAATVEEFAPGNDIRVMMIEVGWAWVIPLPNRRLSVGVVSRSPGIANDDVLRYVESSPLLSRWTHGAERSQRRLIGNFSYRNRRSHGSRFACIGDAACFIDPVFSSGVSLAMLGAQQLVGRLAPAFQAGREADPELNAAAETKMQLGYDSFASLVYRFYNTRFVDNFLMGAPSDGALRPSVTSVLAGDVLRPDNPFRDMLLASRINPQRRAAAAESKQASEC